MSFTSTRCDSNAVEDEGPGEQREDDAAGAELEQELAAFAIDEGDGRRRVITHCRTLTATSPSVAWQALIPACLRMMTRKAEDRVDAGGLIEASTMQARMNGHDVLCAAARLPVAWAALWRSFVERKLAHFAQLQLGFVFGRGAAQRGEGLCFFAVAKEPARGFAEKERSEEEDQSGIDDG